MATTKMRERCGVVAAAARDEVAPAIYFCLNALQHRGQEAAGIAIYNEKKQSIISFKGLGLVNEAFKDINLTQVPGSQGIGHTYYSIKFSTPENAQPTVVKTANGDIALAHNGIITNAAAIKKKLMDDGHTFNRGSEEESIAFMISDQLKHHSFEKAVKNVMRMLEGSYSLTLMHNNRVFGLRDPLGIRPLCLGKTNHGYIVASETVALDALGATLIRDVRPGELIELTADEYISYPLIALKHAAHCFFEYVYFARADSIIDGFDVYQTRLAIGRQLAREKPVTADLVVPMPDSGRAHAFGYAEESGIELVEGLMKNRYIGRTFIMPSQDMREKFVQLKVNPIRSIINDKRVVLVDDSIVRGTTMEQIVDLLRSRGAAEVHVRIGSPPIIAPCYFGVDMTNRKQLIGSSKTVPEIEQYIGADSLGYITISGLVSAIGIDASDLCMGCITGEYPISVFGENCRFQKSLESYS